MFSGRTAWDLRRSRLAALLASRRAEGAELLDLTETNPTRVGIACPPHLLEPLIQAAALRYEPEPAGLLSAREAVAADYHRRGYDVSPKRIVLTASTSEAYAFLFKLLCDPGDEVLVPRPSYPLFEYLAGLESVAVRPYPLDYDGRWHLSPGGVREAAGERTRAVVVVHPNNPTGSFLKEEEAQGLESLCAEGGWALISDEVFADYAFREDPERARSVARDGEVLAFALGGLSKSCGLPQLKLAWIAVSGPRERREAALARLEVVADTYLSVGTPVQLALPRLLQQRAELQRPIVERVAGNLDLLRERATGSPATLLDAEGGWSAVLRVPAVASEEDWALTLLDEDGVLVHPGYFFDFAQEAFLVLSLLPPPATFRRGVERLLRRLGEGPGATPVL